MKSAGYCVPWIWHQFCIFVMPHEFEFNRAVDRAEQEPL